MAVTEKKFHKAEWISLAGLGMQLLGLVVTLVLSRASLASSMGAEVWHWLGGVLMWVLLLVFFHQKRLEALETLELDELRRQREQSGQSALFEVEAEDLLVAGRRLRTILRYVFPIATVALVAYHIGIGAWLWAQASVTAPLNAETFSEIRHSHAAMAVMAALTFLSFITSQSAVGTAKDASCRMIRAGGNYLMGNCLISLVLVAVVGMADFGWRMPELVVTYVVPVLLIVLGVEMVLNLILEMYRPRTAGSEPRPAFESRLLGLVSEPSDVARSVAEAMNYQFGFEISRTWFYQLLQRALGPLLLFQIAGILALTMFIVVEPGQRALVERFGKLQGQPLQPGLHFKWPWPIEQVRAVDTDRIREIVLGTTPDADGMYSDMADVVLWSSDSGHGQEYDLLVAPPASVLQRAAATRSVGTDVENKSVAVHLLRIVASLRYRIANPVDYTYNYSNPDQILTSTIQQAFLSFTAARDSDQLMTAERKRVSEELRTELVRQIAQMKPSLGVELVDVSLVGVHPPPAVAASYEQVGAGELIRSQMVWQAKTYASNLLGALAGGSRLADELSKAIEAVDAAGPAGSSPQAATARRSLAELLDRCGGDVARILNGAEAERTSRENKSLADVAEFKAKLKAYRQAPQFYAAAGYLDAMARVLKPVRKYLIASPTGNLPLVVTFDMKDQQGTFDLGSTKK